jgi:hypothetical protein
MELSKLILDFIAKIAWPIVVLCIAFIFKNELGNLVLRLYNLKYKDLELSFSRDVRKAEETASESKLPSPDALTEIPESKDNISPFDRLKQLSKEYPAAAVMEAWRILELSIISVAKTQNLDISKMRNSDIILKLIDLGKTDKSIYNLFNRLRVMRNSVAHTSAQDSISANDALRYVELALSLASYFNTLIQL